MYYSDKNKVIIKNSMMLYVRMLFKMSVALYTSRIVLEVLGVDDFGIYSIVGGVVSLFTFLNGTMSGATSRFLTCALGLKNQKLLNDTFSTALTLHIGIALCVLVLGETVGWWLLENKLVIPEERMFAARVVYQFSVLSCMVSITQVPYNSSILSHEKMNVYAYVSVLDVILQLLIVYLLKICDFDHLILYSIFLFVVMLIIAFIYRIYCLKNFSECHYNIIYDKKILYPMLSFSGWDLFGNMSVMLRGQGVNILHNLFFGVVVNAASSIANQVLVALSVFADNILVAIRPQIVKSYVEKDYSRMQFLVVNAAKYAYLLLLVFAIPLLLENEYILNLWLVNIPKYAVGFCQMNILICMIIVLFRPITYSLHSVGRLKYSSLISGGIYALMLLFTYVLFKLGYSPITPYFATILAFIFCSLSNIVILKYYFSEFSAKMFLKKVLGICALVSILSIVFPVFVYMNMGCGFYRLLLVSITSFLSVITFTFYLGIGKTEKIIIVYAIKKWLKVN